MPLNKETQTLIPLKFYMYFIVMAYIIKIQKRIKIHQKISTFLKKINLLFSWNSSVYYISDKLFFLSKKTL